MKGGILIDRLNWIKHIDFIQYYSDVKRFMLKIKWRVSS